jgi:hypothetical protein
MGRGRHENRLETHFLIRIGLQCGASCARAPAKIHCIFDSLPAACSVARQPVLRRLNVTKYAARLTANFNNYAHGAAISCAYQKNGATRPMPRRDAGEAHVDE